MRNQRWGIELEVRNNGHCTYMFTHEKEYPGILLNYMRKAGLMKE